jgi:hypothetical protein
MLWVPASVTLPRRTAATLTSDRPGSCRCLEAQARRCVKDHESDSCDPTHRPRWWPGGAAWVLWALTMLAIPVIAWLDQLSRQAGRPDLAQLTFGALVGPVLAAVSGTTVGAVLASRRPRHPVGWLLLVLGLSLAWGGVVPAYAAYGLLARPGALPAADAVARYWPITVVTAQTALSFVLLLTPTGSLPSPRWRWWARVTLAAAVILLMGLAVVSGPLDPQYQLLGGPFDFRGQGGVLLVVNQLALAVTSLAVVVGAASLVVRFGRATGVERQQLRWVAWAAALAVPGAVVALGGVAVGPRPWSPGRSVPVSPFCRWRSGRPSCAIGSMTWTGSSAGRWPMGCSRCCWVAATPWSSWAWASALAEVPAWSWPRPPWPWPPSSSRPAAASRPRSTGASTAAATTPPRRSPRSVIGCTSRSIWTP